MSWPRVPHSPLRRVRLWHATRAAQQVSRSQPVTCRATEARAAVTCGILAEYAGTMQRHAKTKRINEAYMCTRMICASFASNKPEPHRQTERERDRETETERETEREIERDGD